MIFKRQGGIKDMFSRIADEILVASESVPDSILNTLIKLTEKYPGAVYWICRKFVQEYLRFYIADSGHIGISDRLLPGIMYPGDVVVYTAPEKLKTGDVIQIIFTDEKDEEVRIVHGKISSFNTDGSVEVEDITSCEKYRVGKWNILGKLVKIIPFGSLEWQEIFYNCGDNEKWLKQTIEEIIKEIEKSDLKDKNRIIEELKDRLSKLG